MAVALLCFICFIILLRHFQVSRILSAAGGFLFAFGMVRMIQLAHSQLLPQFFTPLAFLFVWKFLRKPSPKRLIGSLLLIYLQILASVYLGWLFVFSLLIFVPIVLYLDRNIRNQLINYFRLEWRSTIGASLVWLLAVILLFLPYLKIAKLIGPRPFSEVASMLPRFSSWLSPAPQTLWAPILSPLSQNLPVIQEHWIFLGFVTFALVGFALYVLRFRSAALSEEKALLVKACLATVTILIVLSLYISDFTLWRIVYNFVPGATSMRAMGRIVFVVEFYGLVASLICVDSFLKSTVIQYRLRSLIALIILLVSIPEQIIFSAWRYDKMPLLQNESALSSIMAQGCEIAYVSISSDKPYYAQQISAMWAGLAAGVPVVNGYSGATPPNLPSTQVTASFSELVQWLTGKVKGRLCLIHPNNTPQVQAKQLEPGIALDSIADTTEYTSDRFTAFVVPLPLNRFLKQYTYAMRLADVPKLMQVNGAINLALFVRNTSSSAWLKTQEAPISLVYRWLKPNGTIAVAESQRTPLPRSVLPKEAVALNAIVNAPDRPGEYILRLTLVQEYVTWFVDQGAEPLDVPIKVVR